MTGCIQVEWPPLYEKYMDKLSEMININIAILDSACVFPPGDYMVNLFGQTMGPIMLSASLAGYFVFKLLKLEDKFGTEAKELLKSVTSSFLALTYIVLPSASLVIFRTFACDADFDYGERYLKYDYTISCNSETYIWWMSYASLMILIYPVRSIRLHDIPACSNPDSFARGRSAYLPCTWC